MSSEDSPSRDNLVSALARAQSKFPPIVKSHTNPAFKGSQYADVADVLAAVRPVLAAEEIALTQSTVLLDGGTVGLCTALLYGVEREESIFPLSVDGLTAQQVGSLLTYHRRYQLCAILGVHPVGDDDDGNLAATAAPQPAAEPAESERLASYRSTVQERIAALSDSAKETVAQWIRNHRVPSLKKPGATFEQLEDLFTFIAGLDTEPFELPPSTEPNVIDKVTTVSMDVNKPFEPVVFNPETGQSEPVNPAAKVRAGLSGTERKAANSAMKAER